MSVLVSCWLIIDSVLIPEGFQKWNRLGYFIHPVLLIFCQILLWVASATAWISYLVSYPLIRIWNGVTWVFILLKGRLACLFWMGESVRSEAAIEEDVCYEIDQAQKDQEGLSMVDVRGYRVLAITEGVVAMVEEINGAVEEENREEEQGLSVGICEIPSLKREVETQLEEDERNEGEQEAVAAGEEEEEAAAAGEEEEAAAAGEEEEAAAAGEEEEEEETEETDGFYKKYSERMKWFDLLNQERASGMSAVLKAQLGHSESQAREGPSNLPNLYQEWRKQAQRRLIKSLEGDVEMAYVGQTCLCWEALHYQYRKVEAIASCNSVRGAFYDEVARKFQQFQVLLERFTEEEERIKGKRYWNYVHGRFPLKNLLQVPEVSAQWHLKRKKGSIPGQAIFASEALRVIEKSIRAFWVFLKTDNISSFWSLRTLLWTSPQVENPKDLEFQAKLRKALQKKELGLKELEGKNKCWLKRTITMEDAQRVNVLFAMIDMKLVSRVLKMSVITTNHLKWCQEKLDGIEFSNGSFVRGPNSSLFPPS